ncbi:hypothetical protein GCM10027429_29660 [Marivirga atlantica]|jgi:hypothetical protein|uniref:Yeast cell wall synthesis Kre9/Knh1-like N-terminal domain-containing protein n=1 Tax=Marivirga atlantica TaxID=1548457 RepID=A0A937ACZ8_9BACT|nr:Ser-Thr-rich GPI-anchored membrane family protein [Marivirga atlantica]MBL0766545.1 hypothetical protein [Marivirga atlantica]
MQAKFTRSILFSLFFLLTVSNVYSQRVEIDRIFFKNAKVHVQYKLHDDKKDRSYQIQLYGSKDNYISPLKETTGDVGVEIYAGDSKEIIWDPFAEYGDDFNEEIALEIRGRVYIPFVKLDDFNYTSLKRGKLYDLTWTGGSSSNILNIELYKGDNKVALFSNIANVGEYDLIIPKDVQPGKGYRLRISDKSNKDDIVFSDEFKVKRKYPLALQIGAGAVVAGGIYFLITQLGGDEAGPANNDIEGAPQTPQSED